MPLTRYNLLAGQNVDRLAAISDGVFAFAMTLLVLDLKLPPASAIHTETELRQALVELAPNLLVWLMSFMTLGIFWVGQQTQLNVLRQSSRALTWRHLGFLAFVSIMPFTTSLMAGFITYRAALLVYWANILILGLILLATWRTAMAQGLVEGDADSIGRAVERRIIYAQLLYAVGAALCVASTYWSILFIVLVQLNYVIAPRVPGLDRL